jgi:hypothetical protein
VRSANCGRDWTVHQNALMGGLALSGKVEESGSSRRLCAVLMNPPLEGGGRSTNRNLEAARCCLDCESVEVANLLSTPSKNFDAIARVGRELDRWEESRPALKEALERADVVLLGWGVGGIDGAARSLLQSRNAGSWILPSRSAISRSGPSLARRGIPRGGISSSAFVTGEQSARATLNAYGRPLRL